MAVKEFTFENGDRVREIVTGFKGIVTGTAFYLTGCTQYLVTAEELTDGEAKAFWYDEGRLLLCAPEAISAKDVATKENGSDITAPGGMKGA